MIDLQGLDIGDVIYYAGKRHTIKDWYCFKDKQLAPYGFTVYSIPILDNGQLLDWLYWGDVVVPKWIEKIIGPDL